MWYFSGSVAIKTIKYTDLHNRCLDSSAVTCTPGDLTDNVFLIFFCCQTLAVSILLHYNCVLILSSGQPKLAVDV
jgi:hypothetical protein